MNISMADLTGEYKILLASDYTAISRRRRLEVRLSIIGGDKAEATITYVVCTPKGTSHWHNLERALMEYNGGKL